MLYYDQAQRSAANRREGMDSFDAFSKFGTAAPSYLNSDGEHLDYSVRVVLQLDSVRQESLAPYLCTSLALWW